MTTAKPTITLLTNIRFVQYGDIRMDCSAVVLEWNHKALFDGRESRIRGFGPDGSWPVFTLWLRPDVDYTLSPAEDRSKLMMSGNGDTKPIFSGTRLELADGRALFLQSEDHNRPLDVDSSFGDDDYERLWSTLRAKASEYWRAPYMPRLRFDPPMKEQAQTL